MEDIFLDACRRQLVLCSGWLSGVSFVNALKSVDVVVNPSLRAWSETFCIANIEVMAMSIPLVTFAVGGVCMCVYISI